MSGEEICRKLIKTAKRLIEYNVILRSRPKFWKEKIKIVINMQKLKKF